MITILGIDPGSRITGFGIISSDRNAHKYITSGSIIIDKKQFAEKLQKIFHDISQIITEYKPETTAIEQVFMHTNASSALKLGQARGAAIVALANHELPVAEYSPRQIKQAVVGYGGADKNQVQHMVKCILKLKGDLQSDAADALAIAICHAHSMFRKI